jgi:type II secretory pathway pseudopilin PulG
MMVVVVILVIAGITAPKMVQIIDTAKLQASAQAYAGLLQVARSRAVQDDAEYQVLTAIQNGTPIAYVDLNGNRQFDSGGSAPEPAVLLANPITVSDTGVPSGFETVTLLNIIPLNLETSPMVDTTGAAAPGLAFNQRGLPCQRLDKLKNCLNSMSGGGLPPFVAWVTYFQFARRTGGTSYAAITVTPAGRVKTWSYQNDKNGGGSWQ